MKEKLKEKLRMYRCAHCPYETDTCYKLVYPTHTVCLDTVIVAGAL
jgi:hypothetical protein